MKSPAPIHLTTTAEVAAGGWVAEARDNDGHLISTLAWDAVATTNENLQSLGEFIQSYDDDTGTVQVFTGTVVAKLSN